MVRNLRFHFREKPLDLGILTTYTSIVLGLQLVGGTGNLLAIFSVVLTPGYAFVAMVFPRSASISWSERLGLSIGTSLAIAPLVGLVLNASPQGIRLDSVTILLTLLTLGLVAIAYIRRMRLPSRERLSATLEFGSLPSDWIGLDRILVIGLVASMMLGTAGLVYVLVSPRPREPFTEFYLTGPGGNTSAYPTSLKIAEPATVGVTLVNREAATVGFTVRIDLVGVRIVYNATTGFNETVEVNRTTWSMFKVTLADGRNWTQPYTFRISATGMWKVQFLLFKDGDVSSEYRELHLYVRVT